MINLIRSIYTNRYYWKKYYSLKSLVTRDKICGFRNLHAGKTIFCIGTGPSLKSEENLMLLNDQIVIFTNASFKLTEEIKPFKSYWFVQDFHRLEELKHVNRKQFDASFKTFHNLQYTGTEHISKNDILLLPEMSFRQPDGEFYPKPLESQDHFQVNLEEQIALAGSSVIFSSIQLAAYMGAKKIVLLGVDMSYGTNVQESYFDGEEVKERFSWKLDYEQYSKKAFVRYNNILKARAITLINSTKNTREDVTLKLSIPEALKY